MTGVDWYKDSVSVEIADNGDPGLQDASAGSGVDPASFSSPFSVSANDTSTHGRTVKDMAANESDPGQITVAVDAVGPTVSITGCPAAPVALGSSQSIVVSAGDGESGLADDPSGTVSLETASVGQKTKTLTAKDRVGHEKSASCIYSVNPAIYDWSGFYRPVDNKDAAGNYILNRAKAGSAIPVKFSLDGAPMPASNTSQGLDIMAAGSPSSGQIVCDPMAAADEIEQTLTAGSSSLSYDASAGRASAVSWW